MNEAIVTISDQAHEILQAAYRILPQVLIGIVVLVLFAALSAGAKATVAKTLERRGRHDLGSLLGGFVKWGFLLFGVLVFATVVFPSVKPVDLLASLGLGSVAIGFAFKDIFQNWISGLLILYARPFRQGDQIKSGSFEGTIEAITARATQLRTYDGQLVLIPNSDIYTGTVIIRTAFEARRSEYDVGIGYGDDISLACQLIADAIRKLPEVNSDPAPEAIPWELAGSSVNIRVRWWTAPRRSDVVSARGPVIAAIKKALSESGIDLPFPTQVVLFHDQTEETDGDRRKAREGWPAGDNPPGPRRLNANPLSREVMQGPVEH